MRHGKSHQHTSLNDVSDGYTQTPFLLVNHSTRGHWSLSGTIKHIHLSNMSRIKLLICASWSLQGLYPVSRTHSKQLLTDLWVQHQRDITGSSESQGISSQSRLCF